MGNGGEKPDLRLGAAEDGDGEGVFLRLEPQWGIVLVPHPLRVVHADHRRLRLDLGRHRKPSGNGQKSLGVIRLGQQASNDRRKRREGGRHTDVEPVGIN